MTNVSVKSGNFKTAVTLYIIKSLALKPPLKDFMGRDKVAKKS